jgi:hypothetical protein
VVPWINQEPADPLARYLLLPAQTIFYAALIMFDFIFLQANNQFIYFQF